MFLKKSFNNINFDFLNIKLWFGSIFIFIISWIFYKYGLFSQFLLLDDNFSMNFLHFTSIYVFSNLSGSFVFFMPAGIGAIETIFTNLIENIDKTGFILTSLILFRILTILSSSLLLLILNIRKP